MLVNHGRFAHFSNARPIPRVRTWRLPVAALALAAGIAVAWHAPAIAQIPAPAPATPAEAAVHHEPAPPADLHDLTGWLDFKARAHVATLPHEARLFYRAGLLARERGQRAESMRLVRGAAELDPSFIAPHLTLASWSATREPSQSLLQYATVIELARQNFMMQLALAANAMYLSLQALFLGLLAAGVILVAVHANELRHPWEEWLSRQLMPESARWWSWGFVVLPYVAGFGPVLPTLAFLGMLWPVLKVRERTLFVCLLLAALSGPWTVAGLSRMATPLHEDRAPLFGVPTIENVPWSEAAENRLVRLNQENPQNPYVAFGLAWMSRRGGHLAQAEAAYRRVLELWPENDVALNNLGNSVAMQGRPTEALALFQRASTANPENAAAWFNASQLYTQRFEYKAATEALSKASALDFEMVKNYQSQGTDDGLLPLVDQWVSPRTFWLAMGTADTRGAQQRALPPSWRGRIEATGWLFTALALAAAGLGLGAGLKLAKSMPLRACSNCGRVLCRRCAQRRREVALCRACAAVESRAESPEFARVLLQQYRRKLERTGDMVRTAFATLIPGLGLISYGRVFTPVFLLTLSAAMLSGAMRMAPPFSYEPRLLLGEESLPLPLVIGVWGFIYAVSLLGYVHQSQRRQAQAAMLAAPVRSRSVQATRLNPPAAAA